GPTKVEGRDPATAHRDQRGGAGVVGVAGGDQPPGPWVPPFDDTKGVGVYGISPVAEGVIAQGGDSAPGMGLRATGYSGVEATGRFIGVKAEGGTIGVQAISYYGPAGYFYRFSEMPVPQIFITPTYMPVPDPVDMETVSALPPDE